MPSAPAELPEKVREAIANGACFIGDNVDNGFVTRIALLAVRETARDCADICIQEWEAAAAEPTYRANSISHGCVASSKSIRTRYHIED